MDEKDKFMIKWVSVAMFIFFFGFLFSGCQIEVSIKTQEQPETTAMDLADE